jgi:hypothetical protein
MMKRMIITELSRDGVAVRHKGAVIDACFGDSAGLVYAGKTRVVYDDLTNNRGDPDYAELDPRRPAYILSSARNWPIPNQQEWEAIIQALVERFPNHDLYADGTIDCPPVLLTKGLEHEMDDIAAEAELKAEQEAYEDKLRREALADLMPCRRLLDLDVEFQEAIE